MTFEACLLRKEGREAVVKELLQERLPRAIRAWSVACGLSSEACKQSLRALFTRAQEQVEIASLQRRLMVDEICSRLSRPSPSSTPGRVAAEVIRIAGPIRLQRRVPLDDIPAMLDALAEAETESIGRALGPIHFSPPEMSPEFSAAPCAEQVA